MYNHTASERQRPTHGLCYSTLSLVPSTSGKVGPTRCSGGWKDGGTGVSPLENVKYREMGASELPFVE